MFRLVVSLLKGKGALLCWLEQERGGTFWDAAQAFGVWKGKVERHRRGPISFDVVEARELLNPNACLVFLAPLLLLLRAPVFNGLNIEQSLSVGSHDQLTAHIEVHAKGLVLQHDSVSLKRDDGGIRAHWDP